jgi:hypothetical protein
MVPAGRESNLKVAPMVAKSMGSATKSQILAIVRSTSAEWSKDGPEERRRGTPASQHRQVAKPTVRLPKAPPLSML